MRTIFVLFLSTAAGCYDFRGLHAGLVDAGDDAPTVTPDASPDASPPDAGCFCADDGNPCTEEVCSGGACVHRVAADQTPCPDGLCYTGACCRGCWDGTSCRQGTALATCGVGGAACANCDD